MTKPEIIEKLMEILSSEAFTFGYDQKQAEYVLNELEDFGIITVDEIVEEVIDTEIVEEDEEVEIPNFDLED